MQALCNPLQAGSIYFACLTCSHASKGADACHLHGCPPLQPQAHWVAQVWSAARVPSATTCLADVVHRSTTNALTAGSETLGPGSAAHHRHQLQARQVKNRSLYARLQMQMLSWFLMGINIPGSMSKKSAADFLDQTLRRSPIQARTEVWCSLLFIGHRTQQRLETRRGHRDACWSCLCQAFISIIGVPSACIPTKGKIMDSLPAASSSVVSGRGR